MIEGFSRCYMRYMCVCVCLWASTLEHFTLIRNWYFTIVPVPETVAHTHTHTRTSLAAHPLPFASVSTGAQILFLTVSKCSSYVFRFQFLLYILLPVHLLPVRAYKFAGYLLRFIIKGFFNFNWMSKLAKAATETWERNLTNRKKKVFMPWVLFAKCLTANSLQTTPTPRPHLAQLCVSLLTWHWWWQIKATKWATKLAITYKARKNCLRWLHLDSSSSRGRRKKGRGRNGRREEEGREEVRWECTGHCRLKQKAPRFNCKFNL